MSDDGIPEDLRDGGQDLPDELAELIEREVKRNVPGVTITSIGYSDPVAVLTGDFEQAYPVKAFRPKNGGTEEGIVVIELREDADEWSAHLVSTSL